jgi:hypothetical protein
MLAVLHDRDAVDEEVVHADLFSFRFAAGRPKREDHLSPTSARRPGAPVAS